MIFAIYGQNVLYNVRLQINDCHFDDDYPQIILNVLSC